LHTRWLVKPFDLEIPRKIRQPVPIIADTMNNKPGSSDALPVHQLGLTWIPLLFFDRLRTGFQFTL